MTFAVIPWLSISINLLLVVFVLVCLLMILIILMQRPKQDGLGAAFGGGVTDQVFGARTTNVLQRATVYLGSAFFLISLALAVMFGIQNRGRSTVTASDHHPKPAIPAPAAPAGQPAPKSLSDELPPETTAPTPDQAPADGTTPPVEVPPPAPAPIPDATPAPIPDPAPAPVTPPPADPAPIPDPAESEGP